MCIFINAFFLCCSRTALTLDTPGVTLYPAQLPVGATVTVINGMKWVWVAAPVETRLKRSPMDLEEEVTFRAHRPTAELTPALLEPLTIPTLILIMAAPPRCWLPVEAERAGRGRCLPGTVPLKEAAGCWRGLQLLLSPQVLLEKGVLTGQAGPPRPISSLETAAPTAWVTLDHTQGSSLIYFPQCANTYKVLWFITVFPHWCVSKYE